MVKPTIYTLLASRKPTPIPGQQTKLVARARARISQRAPRTQQMLVPKISSNDPRRKVSLYRWANGLPIPRDATESKTGKVFNKRYLMRVALGGVFLLPLLSGYYWYISHLDKVPITNRVRFMWPVSEQFAEELGCTSAKDLKILDKPSYDPDQLPSVMVRKIIDRLLEAEEAKGLEIRVHVYEDYGQYWECCWDNHFN